MNNQTKDPDIKGNGMLHTPSNDKNSSMSQSFDKLSQRVSHDVGSLVGDMSAKSSSYIKSTREYVEENPIQSVALAAAAGIALGSIITMASRRSPRS